MTRHRLGVVVRQLRQAADPTDAALLQAYLEHKDGDAFATLVRRYQTLVAGVCRRVLGHEQDAEDAAQATFLVLAKKAGSVRKGESLASWLYGTAYRIALQARRTSARRKARDGRGRTAEPADPVAELTWREVQTALDEEVQRLPETHRAAFVLCCLQGVSYAEAGARLGVGEKAISSRVTRARQRLYDRLKGRGVELSAVLAAVGIASTAVAGSASATAGAVLAHQAGTSGLPATVVTLAEGATRTMLTTRTTLAALLIVVVGLAGLGATGLYRQPAPAALPAPADSKDQKPARKEAPDQAVEITGRVNGPDGKPFAGAEILLWTDRVKAPADLAVRARSGKDGMFRLTTTRAELERRARVVARAKGHGPDWTERAPDGKAEVTLTLTRDDVPIE